MVKKQKLKYLSGTQDGKQFRLKGKGMPYHAKSSGLWGPYMFKLKQRFLVSLK